MTNPGEGAPVLHMWSAEVDFVIAESADEAARIFKADPASEACDGEPGDGFAPEDWTLVPDEKIFAFDRHGDGKPERKPAREFVAEFGKGYFASSEY